ncbi:MAG: hypothetical protein JST00_22675 [Deltaproteobacteria bacterium]|nr:hypothetical protein [Deltaproteobacteria bacterium]
MTLRSRFLLGLLLASGALVSTVATGEPPKVTAAPRAQAAPVKMDIRAKTVGAPAALTPDQRATVQKAVKLGIAEYSKTKNVSKAHAAGMAGLTGSMLKAYRTQMTVFTSTNAKAAARYGIESGSVLLTNGPDCQYTVHATLTVKNTFGGGFPADRPAPSLDAVTLPSEGLSIPFGGGGPGTVLGSVGLPRLAAGQTATATLSYSGTSTVNGACTPPTLDVGLNFVGVASSAVYVLRLAPGGSDLETFPLGTTPTADSDYPNGFPGGDCLGWRKCPDGTCVPQGFPCSSY